MSADALQALLAMLAVYLVGGAVLAVIAAYDAGYERAQHRDEPDHAIALAAGAIVIGLFWPAILLIDIVTALRGRS